VLDTADIVREAIYHQAILTGTSESWSTTKKKAPPYQRGNELLACCSHRFMLPAGLG